jgi:hypothetical protein
LLSKKTYNGGQQYDLTTNGSVNVQGTLTLNDISDVEQYVENISNTLANLSQNKIENSSSTSDNLTIDTTGKLSFSNDNIEKLSVSTNGDLDLSGSITTASSITASGDIDASNGTIYAESLTTTNEITAGSLTTSGAITAGSIISNGTIDAGSNDITTTGSLSAGSVNTTDLTVSGTSSSDSGYFVTIDSETGEVKRTATSVASLIASATSGTTTSGDEADAILESIQIIAPNGDLLDNSMSTFVDINSGGTTIGGGLTLGTELNTREYLNFIDGNSNTDETKYITDHYITSESNLAIQVGSNNDTTDPSFNIYCYDANDASYVQVFNASNNGIDMPENLTVSGNVGIGVTNPSEAVEIFGNVKITSSTFKYIYIKTTDTITSLAEVQCYINDVNVAASSEGATAYLVNTTTEDFTDLSSSAYDGSESKYGVSNIIDGTIWPAYNSDFAHGYGEYTYPFIILPNEYNVNDIQKILISPRYYRNDQYYMKELTNLILLDSNYNEVVNVESTSDDFPNKNMFAQYNGNKASTFTTPSEWTDQYSSTYDPYYAEFEISSSSIATSSGYMKVGEIIFAENNNATSDKMSIGKYYGDSGQMALYSSEMIHCIESESENIAITMDLNNSRIGIGSTSPTCALDVDGDAAISGDLTVSTDTHISGNVGIGTDANDSHTLDVNGSAEISGDLTVRGELVFAENNSSNSASTDKMSIGKYNSDSGQMAVYCDGAIHFIESDENNIAITMDLNNSRIGIGSTSPTCELDVSGDAAISGDLTVTGTLTAPGTLRLLSVVNDSDSIASASGTIISSTVTLSSTSRIYVCFDAAYIISGHGTDTVSISLTIGNDIVFTKTQYYNGNGGGGTRSSTLSPLMYMTSDTYSASDYSITLSIDTSTSSFDDRVNITDQCLMIYEVYT